MMADLAVAMSIPSREISSLAELIAGPWPVKAWSSGKPSLGRTVRMIGRSNFFAKSQSRWSCRGPP